MAEGTGTGEAPDRNLALELVRVTEAAALAAARHMGRGDKNAVDKAGVDAMRLMLDTVSMRGTVVIGEGEKDEAPMLYNGEEVGDGTGAEVDVAVDPIEGTSLAANAQSRALSCVAVSERGTMFDPGPAFYMLKIAAGEEARDIIDLDAPISENLDRVAKARDTVVDELTVVILDRPRHEDLVRQVREAGARIKLISEGDVEASISAARPGTGVDLSIGIGGTPEGVITATALKCLGGVIQGRLAPQKDEEKKAVAEAGIDTERILTTDDLVRGDNCFFAMTGVTSGDILRGVQYRGTSATTHSMVMRSRSGTVRIIEALHRREKLKMFAKIAY